MRRSSSGAVTGLVLIMATTPSATECQTVVMELMKLLAMLGILHFVDLVSTAVLVEGVWSRLRSVTDVMIVQMGVTKRAAPSLSLIFVSVCVWGCVGVWG